ncbi:MAG: hypothetical protein PHT95_04795 [Candidatus Omnitrophica bacterium]|nr:hypothetical protein [Candidatus Omnitrophota bacterium]
MRFALCALRSALCALIFAFWASTSFSSGKPVEVTAKVDRDKVNIGDRIKLELAVKNADGYELWFQEKPDNFEDITLYSSIPIEGSGKKDPGYEYVVGVYSTGVHVIPPIVVRYRSGEGEWIIARSPQVPINVESLLTEDEDDIRGLKGVVPFSTGAAWKSLVIMLMVGLAGLAVYVRKGARLPWAHDPDEKVKPAHEIAYQELRDLKKMELPSKGRMQEYYFRLSDIVRHYVENRFFLRAPEMTTEEFLEKAKGSEELKKEHKSLLKGFLSTCDMVKFAKYGPTPLEAMDSLKSAEKLVDETKDTEGEGSK